jgi:fumarate reductase subunit C
MAREVTAVFVAAYAVVLLFGMVRLSEGEAAFNGWLQYLKTPWMLVFHLIVLATFVYHTWSWFKIMPKTMPIMFVGGKRVQPGTITGTGIAAAVVACLAVLLIVKGMHP